MASGLPVILSEGSKSYVTGADGLPLEEITGAVVRYLYQDQLGSTRALSDANGVLSASMTYDAYGNLLTSTGSDLGTFRFAGQQLDSETGFYYLRARYYDPGTAQFLSRDPISYATREPYGYAGDSPLNAADPTGEWGFGKTVCGQGDVGAGVAAVGGSLCAENLALTGNDLKPKSYGCAGGFAGGNAEFSSGRGNWGAHWPQGGALTGPTGTLGESFGVGGGLVLTNASSDAT